MQTNVVGTKIHTHVRAKTQHSNGALVLAISNTISKTPEEAIATIKAEFPLVKYTQTYSHDLDGNTEYIIFRGTTKDGFRLTAHSFSCYCEPLNENQEPPF